MQSYYCLTSNLSHSVQRFTRRVLLLHLQVLYTIYWDGTNGIERVIVTFILQDLVEANQLPLLQAFETEFLKVRGHIINK